MRRGLAPSRADANFARRQLPMPDATRLEMTGISQRFGATQALADVSLAVRPGEVRALVGENGAGKSTLMKILAGALRPDAGRMTVDGRPYAPRHPADALRTGVAMIYQELNLAPHLSVEANILLGQERHRGPWLRARQQRQAARAALARLGQAELPLEQSVATLSLARQQVVEIARALASEARVLVFDEPTSSLTEEDAAELFRVIGELKRSGLGVVYISHFLEELARVADTFTVLRDGRVVAQGKLAETSLDALVTAMVGRELDQLFPQVPHTLGPPLLEVAGLPGPSGSSPVGFTLRRGEILGLAGLVGAGRSRLLRRLFGLAPRAGGVVSVAGRRLAAGNPRASIRAGLGLVSEDRKQEGLALELSIADNLTLTRLAPHARFGFLNLRHRADDTARWMREVRCKAAGPDQPVGRLSGGNQQKVALARLLHQEAEVLLLDEPTRGIDIAAKADLYRLVGQLAAGGKAVVMVSSYLPELLHLCDTIGVMCRGQLREVRPASQWTAESIMHAATGREVPA